MYVKVDKIKEDIDNVWYSFCSDMAGEKYINERGIPRQRSVEVKGVCVFNKVTNTFSIDWDQTDFYFKTQFSMAAIMRCKLMEYHKNGSFPELFDIATG